MEYGESKRLFIHYLSDATHYIQIDSHMSLSTDVRYKANSRTAKVITSADDKLLYISDANIEKLVHQVNIKINKLYNLLCLNSLRHKGKSKYMIIRSPHKKCNLTGHNVNKNCIAINQIRTNLSEETTKFLGIYFDEYLTWKHHMNYVNDRISASLFMIKQVKHILQ